MVLQTFSGPFLSRVMKVRGASPLACGDMFSLNVFISFLFFLHIYFLFPFSLFMDTRKLSSDAKNDF